MKCEWSQYKYCHLGSWEKCLNKMELFIENFYWSVNPESKTLTIRQLHKHLDKLKKRDGY